MTGPAAVAIGGGHGLAATLRAVRRYTSDITAIVATADDGGSSGRLRADIGVIPPGDLRRCLVALADPESLWTRTFEHRFARGEIGGHAFGNLLIAGLADASGDIVRALDEIGRLMGCIGRVLPATTEVVTLEAATRHGVVVGQVAVMSSHDITEITLSPVSARVHPDVLTSIARADQIILGPGSLFTSVLSAATVPAIREAIRVAHGKRIYICNLLPQAPETAGFSVADHTNALARHGIAIDQVIVSVPSEMERGEVTVPIVEFDVARPNRQSHDSEKLSAILCRLTTAASH